MHFAHLRDSDDCPIKTGNKFTKEEILRVKYNGAKESNLHFELKNYLANFLLENQNAKKGIENVKIEKVFKHKAIPKNWKKPDVSSIFNDKQVVFELQLSTTFLSVINSRQEFYKENRTFIIWVFSSFETNEEKRKFTQSDIFFNNNYNGFEFNKEAIELSKKEQNLILKCYYKRPYIDDNIIKEEWGEKYVNINELTFDKSNYTIYYFNYTKEKELVENELKKILIISESELIQKIKGTNTFEINNLMLSGYLISDEEKQYILELYNDEIVPREVIDQYGWRFNIILVTVFLKIKKFELIKRIISNDHLKRMIFDILSLKLDKIIGYAVTKQIQIVNTVFQSRLEYYDLYLSAINLYQPNLFYQQDKNRKFQNKMIEIQKNKPIQNTENNDIFKIMFPELMIKNAV